MERFLTLYIDTNVPAQFLFDDGKGVAWDNGGKTITYDQYTAVPFPSVVNQIVIHDFQFTAKRMGGAPTITANFTYHECLDKIWSYKVFATFNGERYFIKQTPSSSIVNTEGRFQHSIELVSERIMLDNVYFYDVVSSETVEDKPVSNSSKFSFFGDINEFVRRLNESLKYRGLDYTVVIDSGIVSDSLNVSFENKVISEALQEIYNTYNLPYYFDGKTIHVGYTNNAITETFRYGASDALMSISKENANYKMITAISGSGSEDNIPYYYPNDYESKAEVEANGGTWIQPSSSLQPPVYRESLGKERFYEAKNLTYQIPGTTETYTFKNLYEEGRPKEHIIDFSDIKPTITGIKNALGYGIDTFLDFAYDQDDNDELDEEGNYVHPYFFAKLRKFDGANGFNLFEHAIDEEQMTISMTSGSCGSCEWVIGVGEDTQKNLVQVDSDGNLLRDENGNVRCGREGLQNEEPQDRQNDTQNYEVWIALKKDINTFGVVMPNATNNYKPSVSDTFVILHIDLPKAYILAAEERLKEALIAYMADNNEEKFNFSISFSRIYFAENPDVLAKLNENARVQIEYNGDYIELYVSSFSYTMSETAPLPEIKVELSDTLSISQNAIQTMINDLKGSGFGGIGIGASGDILKLGLAYFLRKDTNDRTRGKLSTDVGFEVGRFVSGASGALIYIDKQTGRTVAELDKLYVRVKAYFETLEIVNVNSVGGKIIVSPAGSVKCINVVESEDGTYYRCYFLAEQDGEKIENRFHVGDQVYSQMFNAKPGVSNKVSNHFWWRLCVGVGEDYIDLSVADSDVDSDVPAIGDVMCQRGNRDDVDRQNFIEISSVDSFSPNMTLFQGVNSYSLVDKDVISYGVDKTTNQAFMNLYGNMYVGDRDGNSYLKYTIEKGLELKGRLHIGTTFGDSTLEDAIKKASTTYKEDLEAYKQAMQTTVDDLQGQIDGAIESWFYDPTPTLNNLPASLWATDEDKNIHLGDLYYSAEGRAYRFQLNSETNTYYWNEIVDTDIVKALENAKKAQDTADSKRKTFVRQPTASDSYDIGDIWLNATYDDGTTKYDNDMLRAVTAKAAGEAFSIEHWTLASKYTDDTVANEALASAKKANEAAGELNAMVSKMKDFTDEAFADGIITRSERVGISQYINQVETVKAQVTQSYNEVYNNALLEGVAKTNLKSGYDVFIAAATELVNQINSVIEDDEATSAERAAVDAKYTVFNTKYGDYTAYLNAAIKSIEEKLNASISEYAYLKKALTQETTTVGGLILTSAVVLGYTDNNKNRITMSGINGLVTEKATRTPAFWVGGDMVDIFDYYDSSTGKFNVPAGVRPATGMDRMDGTGYRAGGALWWDKDGMLHADPLSFFVGKDTVGALLASFQVVLKAGNREPDYLVPKVPFQSLNIATTLDLGKYRLNPGDALELTRTDGKNANLTATGDIVAYSAGDYDLVSPIASASAIGMIKVGNGLSISADGTLSATGAGSIGFVNVDGSGNAITSATVNGTGLILTKGITFWHAGNDGSGSGLDADLLDGLQATAFARADQAPATDLNDVNGKGIMCNSANANATTERNYPIAEAGVLFYGTAAYSSANQIYGSYSSNRWFARGGGSSTTAKTAWKEFAFTTSNVASATKLQTARTINGTSFDGTGNITTSNWGTARNISISDATTTNTGTAVSVNGSQAVTLKLPSTIKASLTGNATTATTLATSRLIWGQSFNGSADVKGDMTNVGSITASGVIQTTSDVVAYAAGNYDIVLPVASANALGAIKVGSGLSVASDGTLNVTATGGGKWGQITGILSNQQDLQAALDGKSNTNHTHTIYAKTVTVGTTVYTVSDNNVTIPAYPTTLKNPNALTISLNGTSQGDYDGSSAKSINITAASIGAAASTHTHSYLPLTGGTLTGALTATQFTSNVATGTAPISVSSTTLCTNLNADMLDGTHKSGLFTQFANSNGQVAITIGGTQKFLTVAYATSANSATTATSATSATSAGKLSTSHTFWGQTFDGTQDVKGSLTNVTSITASGNITTQGDIVAYSAGTTSAAFKYWRPTVNASTGYISWTDSIATSQPDPVYIKGPQGTSISKVEQTTISTADAGTNKITCTLSNGTTSTFSIKNGSKGSKGDKGDKGDTGATGATGATGPAGPSWNGGTISNNITINHGYSAVHFKNSSNTLSWFIRTDKGMYLSQNGQTDVHGAGFQFATTANNAKCNLWCRGDITASGTISDDRLKTYIGEVSNVLDDISNLKCYRYILTNGYDSKPQIGLSAQQTLVKFPELVTTFNNPDDNKEYYTMVIYGVATLGLQGVKELYAIIKQQELRISTLEKQISELLNTNN